MEAGLDTGFRFEGSQVERRRRKNTGSAGADAAERLHGWGMGRGVTLCHPPSWEGLGEGEPLPRKKEIHFWSRNAYPFSGPKHRVTTTATLTAFLQTVMSLHGPLPPIDPPLLGEVV